MLRGIRKASANWLGKMVMAVVVGLLVISFAIWGIGDIFRGFGRSTVAKIGSTEITVEQFRQLYNDRLQQLGRQLGRPITPDQARALGLDQQVLGQLVAETALDERARQLGLGVSDAEVARADHDRSGLSRARPASSTAAASSRSSARPATPSRASSPSSAARRCAASSPTPSSASSTRPRPLIEALNRYQNEQRAIEYVLLDRAQAGEIPAPTPEVLAKYFDDRKIAVPRARVPQGRRARR